MVLCQRPGCQTTAGCICDRLSYQPLFVHPQPPRMMPVNLPFSGYGVTIAIMDGDGNLTIKVDQPTPEST